MVKKYTKITIYCLIAIACFINSSLSAQNTVDLTSLNSLITNDAGVNITWHTGTLPTAGNEITAGNTPSDPTSVPVGATYYMAYYDGTGCYSPTTPVPTLANTCPATTADLTVLYGSEMNNPGSLPLTWHTSSPATTGNLVPDDTMVGTGIYFAAFYDSANGGCYSPATPTIVGIETAAPAPTADAGLTTDSVV